MHSIARVKIECETKKIIGATISGQLEQPKFKTIISLDNICVCVCFLVYLVMYVIYVLVVVFGHLIYRYQKQMSTRTQQGSINTAAVGVTGEYLLYTCCSILMCPLFSLLANRCTWIDVFYP